MEEPKKPRGRPPTPPEEKLELRAMRLKPSHWEKIDAAGMEAFRALIERWRPQKK
jgi:hypothetical protein